MFVQRVPRPAGIAWIQTGLSDEDFVDFADIETTKEGYGRRDGEWVTLFEHTEQRTGDKLGAGSQRAHKVAVTLLGVRLDDEPPTREELAQEVRWSVLARLRNRYRFELKDTGSPTMSGRTMPIVVVSGRSFRGRRTPDLATVTPDVAREFSLSHDPDDLLGYVDDDGEKKVRSIEWQEAFDQGRRRHEPKSSGFLLQVKREFMKRVLQARNMEIWAHIEAKRSIDQYKPEPQMAWSEHTDVFRVRL